MCYPAAMIITETQVLKSDKSDSHEDILAEHGLSDDLHGADFVRVEIKPLNGDYSLPIEQWTYCVDQDELPDWYDPREAEIAARAELPVWYAAHAINQDSDVEPAEIREGESRILLRGRAVQSGGMCWAYGSSHVEQSGGECRAHDSVHVVQSDGVCRACGSSHVALLGGVYWAHDSVHVVQSGGVCWACGSSHVALLGGVCEAYGSSHVALLGGVCEAYGSSHVEQSGGECRAHDSVHVEQSGGFCIDRSTNVKCHN